MLAIALVAIGLLIRLAISWVSWGSNDVITWAHFSELANRVGLMNAYKQDSGLNHPPIPVLWAVVAGRMTGLSIWFPFIFKLPIILFEAFTAWVLWRVWQDRAERNRPRPGRRGERSIAGENATSAVAGYALSLCAILVSGYHCNTDTMFAGLALFSVYLLERQRPFSGGLALAAAINIKIIPVLLIPALLLSLRNRRDVLKFVGGLSIGVIPFVPVLFAVGPSFYQNALAYGSLIDRWGILYFLLPSNSVADGAAMGPAIMYHNLAKWPLLGLIVAWALLARRLHRWNRYDVAAVTFGIFLIFTPGFGVQYTVMIAPLLLATRVRVGAAYSVTAGLFIGAVYFINLTDDYPYYSFFNTMFVQPSPLIGLLAWGTLIYYVATTIKRSRKLEETLAA
ncbi:hypothetical protein BH10PLA1_BH10PLA1_23000 [soil metagenome]